MEIIIERKGENLQLPVSFYIPQVSGDWSVTDRQEKTVPSGAALWTCGRPSSFWDYLYGSPDNLTLGSLQGHLPQDALQKVSIY